MHKIFSSTNLRHGISIAAMSASVVVLGGNDRLKFNVPFFRQPAMAASNAAAEKAKMDAFLKRELDKVFAMQDYTNPDMLEQLEKCEFSPHVSLKEHEDEVRLKYDYKLKTRDEHVAELTKATETEPLDLLIIGGGANGTGVALDAASRGLKCAVIDKYDFASGTSSRSTKLAHGGIRYFEQMVKLQGDPVQTWELVKEALHERDYFVKTAPYLNKEVKLLIPHESLLQSAFWYFPATVGYHLLYAVQAIRSENPAQLSGPRFLLRNAVRSTLPAVKDLHGMYGVVMHEAQMIDGRMALNSLFTASVDGFCKGMRGASLVNHMEFKEFVKKDGKIVGAKLFDRIKAKEHVVHAKRVVNCAGVHADELRLQDNPEAEKRIAGSRGTHLIFKKGLLPADTGIIIPKTRDGRLLFICNYLGHPMVGTTDEKCEVTH